MHKCLFALTAALITSAVVSEGISQISAVLQKQGTRVITFGARVGPLCIGRNHRPIYAVNYVPLIQGLVSRFS